MPTAGFDKDSMFMPSGRGFVETVGSKKLGEVTDVVARYHQWQANKTTGVQSAPLTAVIVSIAEIDAAGNRIAEPVEQELVVERSPKDGSLIRIRPGNAAARGDEAEDTLQDGNLVLGTEGNVLYVEEGMKLSMRSGFGLFALSCQEKGFKPEILGAGFLPDFIGMRAWFTLKEGSGKKQDGTAYTDFIVAGFDNGGKFPYETAAKASKPTAPKASKANGVAKPTTPVPAPAASNGSNAGVYDAADHEATAVALLKHVAETSKPGATLTRQKIATTAMQFAMNGAESGVPKDQAIYKELLGFVNDKSWFELNAIMIGAVNTGEDKYSFST